MCGGFLVAVFSKRTMTVNIIELLSFGKKRKPQKCHVF